MLPLELYLISLPIRNNIYVFAYTQTHTLTFFFWVLLLLFVGLFVAVSYFVLLWSVCRFGGARDRTQGLVYTSEPQAVCVVLHAPVPSDLFV